MKITDGCHVAIDFTLKDDQGRILETTAGNVPLTYVHGRGQIVPGLEAALAGREAAAKLKVVLPPEKAMGAYDDRLRLVVPKTQLPGADRLTAGMSVYVDSDNGRMSFNIMEIRADDVVLDGNHPFAGLTLEYDVEVLRVQQ